MADTRERAVAGGAGQSDRDVSLPSPRRPPTGWLRTPIWLGTLLAVSLAWINWTERLTLVTGLVASLSAVALVVRWPAPSRNRIVASILLVNVALVLAYFWSLGETHHVAVQVTPRSVSALVDGDSTSIPVRLQGSRFGFQASPLPSYRIQATGEAIQSDTTSLPGRIAAAVRLAAPGSGWSNIHVRDAAGRTVPISPIREEIPAGSWGKNRRGEWEGGPGDFLLFAPVRTQTYTVSFDVDRPDGTQSFLLGVNGSGAGYALQLRFDQPDALWVNWKNGLSLPGPGGTGLHHLALVPDMQRFVRVLLTPYLWALLFSALVVGLYALLHTLIPGRSESGWSVVTRIWEWRPLSAFIAAAVAFVGLLITGWAATSLLQRVPHVQDSVAYLFQAKIFADGTLNVPAPPAPIQSFFTEQYVPMFHGKWFSQYPPGHPLVLAVGQILGAPWLVEPVLASLSLACIFLIGRRLYGIGTGLIAALFGLSSPFWLFLGSSFMSHATDLFFLSACILCLILAEDSDSVGWLFLAGLLAGMSFITRQLTAVAALAPFAAYMLLSRRPIRTYLPLLLGGALPLMFFLLYNWVQLGNPLQSTYAAWDPTDGPGFRAVTPGGVFTPADGVWNGYQNLSMLSAQLYGWPYGIALAFAALPFIVGAVRRWDVLLLLSFVAVMVAYMFHWASGLMYGPRFYYEALPAVLLLSSRGVTELWRLPLRVWPRFGLPADRQLAGLAPLALLAGLFLYTFRFYLPAQIPLYRGYNYSSNAELLAVSNAHVHHAIVFVVEHPPGFWASYGNVFWANDPRLRGDIIYVRDEGARDAQLFPYFPGRAHYRLDGSTLTPMG